MMLNEVLEELRRQSRELTSLSLAASDMQRNTLAMILRLESSRYH